jgi:hypothetical protein
MEFTIVIHCHPSHQSNYNLLFQFKDLLLAFIILRGRYLMTQGQLQVKQVFSNLFFQTNQQLNIGFH